MRSQEYERRVEERRRRERRAANLGPGGRPASSTVPWRDPATEGGGEPRLSLVARNRLAAKTKEYLERGFTITGESETAVNLVKENKFHLGTLLIRAVFVYPPMYGARPREEAHLSVEADAVLVAQTLRRPGRAGMLPVGLAFCLYCVLGFFWAVSGWRDPEARFAFGHPALLAIGGYGLRLIARAIVRQFSGVTPPRVQLPILAEERCEADSQTPEERLLAAVVGSREDGYTPIAYDGQQVELYRPVYWKAQGVSKWFVDQSSRIPWSTYRIVLRLKLLRIFCTSIISGVVYLVWVLFGRDARRHAQINHRSEIEYSESSGWLWWRVGLFVVAPGLIVLDRVLA